MVQEFHVLKCFSCETFQTQIVKKTIKWECKVCGIKQSIKKVYGRGSGRDCRLHTQKLNALKGEKEGNNEILEVVKEVNEQPPVNLMKENTANSTNLPKTSKWAEYVDEKEIDFTKNNFSVQERTCPAPISRMKRTREIFEFEVEDNSGIVAAYDDDPVSCFPGYNQSVKLHRNSDIEQAFKAFEEENNESQHLHLRKENRPNKNIQNKISLKWAKYIDDDSSEQQMFSLSQNSNNNSELSSSCSSSQANGHLVNSAKNSTIKQLSLCKPVKTKDFELSVEDLNIPNKQLSYITPKILDECLTVEPFGKRTKKLLEPRHNKERSPPKSLLPVPVFEQDSDLSDSDFQLDF